MRTTTTVLHFSLAAALGLLLGCNTSERSSTAAAATTEPATRVYLTGTSAQPQEDPIRVTVDRASVNTDQGPVPLRLANPEGPASKTLELANLRADSALVATGDDISGATARSVTLTVSRAEQTDPATGRPRPLALEQSELTVPLARPTTLGTRNDFVVALRPELVNGGLRLVPSDATVTTSTPAPTPTPTIPTSSTPPNTTPAEVIQIDDEGESPYSPNNLNSSGNLRIADMETVNGSSNWIICENRPPLETVGPEDTQYTADHGLVYHGGTFDNPTGAPGNGAGVPTGAVLGTVDDFMKTLKPTQP